MLESSSALSEVAKRATAHLRAGRLAEAERELRARLDQAEEWTQGVSLLALVLLEQGRIAEARQLLDDWAGGDEVEVASAPIDSGDTFVASHTENVSLGLNESVRLMFPPAVLAATNTPRGHYYVGVVLDVVDANDSNNRTLGYDVSAIRVLHPAEFPIDDLVRGVRFP